MKHILYKSILIVFLLCFNPIVIGVFWWTNGGYLLTGSQSQAFMALGRLFGLLGAYAVLAQVMLIGRIVWIERLFGLDKLSRVHHWNGYTVLGFLLMHPIFLTTGYATTAKISLWTQFIDFLTNYDQLLNAFIALLLFLGIVVLSITIVRKRLRYESWYFTHLFTYVAIALAFGHQLNIGSDFSGDMARIYWNTLYIIVFGNLIAFRFIRPLYYFWYHRFTIDHIEHETHDTVSVYIKGNNLAAFPIQAGQFMIVRFLSQGFWGQAHPFSLSIAPNKHLLRLTIKNSGDFTSRISLLKQGARILIDGPHGIFTAHRARSKKILFIAGGVGITPIRSLIESMHEHLDDAVLLYANKTSRDIIFKKELDRLHVRIVHVVNNDPLWKGEKGKIDQRIIKKYVPDITTRDIYLCGPPPMMKSMVGILTSLGVTKRRIFYEKFSLG